MWQQCYQRFLGLACAPAMDLSWAAERVTFVILVWGLKDEAMSLNYTLRPDLPNVNNVKSRICVLLNLSTAVFACCRQFGRTRSGSEAVIVR